MTQCMLKTARHRPLMHEIVDKFDEYEGRTSELLVESAIDESETNSPIKTCQESNREVVYLSKTQYGTAVRWKLRIEKINDMKMKLRSKVMLRNSG